MSQPLNVNNLTPRQQDTIKELLDKQMSYYKVDGSCWRIKWNGVLIRVSSGKSSWKTRAHAISAMRNHLSQQYGTIWEWAKIVQNNPKLPYHIHAPLKKEFADYVLASGAVEFVELVG